MKRETRAGRWGAYLAVLCACWCLLSGNRLIAGEFPKAPDMPAHWKVVSDFAVPAAQVEAMAGKLGAELSGVRNTVFEVNGKRVQVNVIVTTDASNAEKLMAGLRSLKSEEALLRKGLVVYEFVGQNDVLPLIAEGRRHLDAK